MCNESKRLHSLQLPDHQNNLISPTQTPPQVLAQNFSKQKNQNPPKHSSKQWETHGDKPKIRTIHVLKTYWSLEIRLFLIHIHLRIPAWHTNLHHQCVCTEVSKPKTPFQAQHSRKLYKMEFGSNKAKKIHILNSCGFFYLRSFWVCKPITI